MTNESARIILLQMLDGLDPTPGEGGCQTRRHGVDGGGRGTAAKAVPPEAPGRGDGP